MPQAREIRKLLGKRAKIAYFVKNRRRDSLKISNLHGKIHGDIFIIDDILDTGGTLVLCAKKLSDLGFKNINILVTHGLFTGNKWKDIFNYGVDKIYCTDTVDGTRKDKRIKIISISDIICSYIKSLS